MQMLSQFPVPAPVQQEIGLPTPFPQTAFVSVAVLAVKPTAPADMQVPAPLAVQHAMGVLLFVHERFAFTVPSRNEEPQPLRRLGRGTAASVVLVQPPLES